MTKKIDIYITYISNVKNIINIIMSLTNNSTLLRVKVTGEIYDSIAKISVEQVYKSTNTNPLEIRYDFALDPNATITNISLQIGERKLIGILNDKYTNAQNYQKAIDNNHTALTLKKYSDNYELKLGNIEPNQELIVKYSYVTILKIVNNKYLYSLPTNIAPRYVQKIDMSNNISNTNNITYSDKILYDFNINLIIKSNNNIISIDCNNQNTDIHKLNDNEYIVISNTNPSDGDFVITYTTEIKPNIYKYKEYYYLNFNFPTEEITNDTPKIYNIIIDRSGSMNDYQKIDYAKDSLKLFVNSLPSNCFFNIISFGTEYNALWQNPCKYTDDTIKKANEYITKITANMGGTELYKCLEACIRDEIINYTEKQWLSDKITENYENIIIVLTDGQITGNVQQIFENNKDKKFRINTLGIGRDANKIQLENIALFGNGICRMSSESKTISDNVIDILEISNMKYYRNIKYKDNKLINCAYPNMFIPIFFKDDNNDDTITLNYIDNFDNEYTQNISLMNIDSGMFIAQLYMNNQIENNKIDYKDITDISKKYSILTEDTSFFLYDVNKINNFNEEENKLERQNIQHYNKLSLMIDLELEDQSCIIDEQQSSNRNNRMCVLENLSPQRAVMGSRLVKKSAKLTRSESLFSRFSSRPNKQWCSAEYPSKSNSSSNLLTSFLNLFKSTEKIEKEKKEKNKQRKQKTDDMRKAYGLLEDTDDDIDDKKIKKVDIIDFRTSDGSFKLCDELILLCDFKDKTEFYTFANNIEIPELILINIIVLTKLLKLNENKYKLIIKYLEKWLENQIDYNTYKLKLDSLEILV
jgi:hypothetical protein